MSTGWVAASVRARAMARRRAGAGAARLAADRPDLPAALRSLAGTPAAPWLAGCTTVAEAEHAGRADLLWSVRVLAGWSPARGTGVLRSVAAGFERENLVAHAQSLADPARRAPAPFELGALATAWQRAGATTTPAAFRAALATSAWGDPGGADELADVLTTSWLVRLAAGAPGTRDWARDAAALVVARRVLLDRPPAPRLVEVGRRLVGSRWAAARSVADLRAALPRADALDGVTSAADLWLAEAALRGRVQREGFAMLRRPAASPEVVVGAVAVLAVDTWRVTAALGAAASGAGREVLDAAA